MNGSLIELGMAATTLALFLACASVALSLASVAMRHPAFAAVAQRALIANFGLSTIACATVVWAFIQNDFSVAYVAQNSNSRLPLVYRLTALWGAHEGSLLLWYWMLSFFSATAVLLHRRQHPRYMPYVMATLAAVQIGFLALILFLSSPFTEITPAPIEGRDLNPLLQDPGLIIHPPMLYLGYVGFVVPFAFAIAALIRGNSNADWVVAMRGWILFAWTALTSGIMLGGYWAYYELGWGGYWAWDPVENASLMPWLMGTALLHSIMAQEKRKIFQAWNAFLAIATFSLSLLGTFLVRSGVLTSVHAFAVDPTRGLYLLIFLGLVTVGSFGLLIFRADLLRSPARIEGLLSRETALVLNNLLLVLAASTVFVGTLYPLVAEVTLGSRVTVAAPYFNKTVLPVMVALVALMAVGPLIPWRKAGRQHMGRLLLVPGAVGVAAVVVGLLYGVHSPVALAALAGVGLVVASVITDTQRSLRARSAIVGSTWSRSLMTLVLWNRRRYGGYIVHLGVSCIAFGIVASGLFQESKTVVLSPGDRFNIGDYLLTFNKVETVVGPNWTARQANLDVVTREAPLGSLHPQRRNYPNGQMTTTESAIHSTLFGDLYVVIGEELANGRASIRAYFIPLVGWIWVGWFIIIAGALFALSQPRTAVVVTSKHRQFVPEVEGGGLS